MASSIFAAGVQQIAPNGALVPLSFLKYRRQREFSGQCGLLLGGREVKSRIYTSASVVRSA